MNREPTRDERRPSSIRTFSTIVGIVFAVAWVAAAISIRAPLLFVVSGAVTIALALLLLHRLRRLRRR